MKRTILAIVTLFIAVNLHAQRMSVDEYIETYKDAAIAQMNRLGVPASIILAQGILETESGNSDLVKRSNNHFGIKCKSTWTGPSVTHTDDAPDECFRKYASAEESYRDHSDYLNTSPRYASLFNLASTDYKGWAYGLKRAGYATNPRYPQILISNIEKYNLQQYNSPVTARLSKEPAMGSTTETVSKTVKTGTSVVSTEEASTNKDKNVFKKLFSGKKNKNNQYFNNLKAVMVFNGTSLLAVATENDVPLAKLLEYNDLEADGIVKEDQWIYLEKKPKEGNREVYEALQDESLFDISQNNGVQLESLASYNNMPKNGSVQKGTKVALRPGVQVSNTSPVQPENRMHEVQAKEGLYSIAKKYNVTVDELRLWNNLGSNDIRLGQQLIIAK